MVPRNAPSLRNFEGRIVLAGAGKMGGAMLQGWLADGLSAKNLTVIEPQPDKALKALVRRGLVLNPKQDRGKAAVIVVALTFAPALALGPLAEHFGMR